MQTEVQFFVLIHFCKCSCSNGLGALAVRRIPASERYLVFGNLMKRMLSQGRPETVLKDESIVIGIV
jgi:hypothetical protein